MSWVASPALPSDSAAISSCRAGSTPATSRTPSALPLAVTVISAPQVAEYSLATSVMVGANAVEPTIVRLPSAQSTTGPEVLIGRITTAAIHRPANRTSNSALTSGHRD